MLVLSRRSNQSILFPALGIAVKVIDTKGQAVRLGIHAPPHVEIFREELLDAQEKSPGKKFGSPTDCKWTHHFRGRLNSALMGLYVVEKQLEAGAVAEADANLRDALKVLESLDQEIGAKKPDATAGASSKRIHALLVEDDLNEEALLASYLRMSGFEIQTAHDGYEAMEFLSSHERPDFVLLDMRMPRLDGPSTIAAIRNNPAFNGIRIFAVSGTPRDDIGELPQNARIDGWFQKPLNPARLAEAMTAAWNN